MFPQVKKGAFFGVSCKNNVEVFILDKNKA